ncbi:MAG: preprotein translocase subunit SecG [Alistipes sp.]|nr:preprotein translocase subunit SecG [Alistipes sp.]
MYIFLIVLILVASLLMVLAVLVQNPKSGMASNFGASNQVMGVRQTADFLEKFTWGAAATILALSLLSVVFIENKATVSSVDEAAAELLNGAQTEQVVDVPQAEVPAQN